MQIHLPLFLKKALLASVVAHAASFTALADGEIYDNQIFPEGSDFSTASYNNSSWINASVIGGLFYYSELKGANFTGADLTNADFEGADLYNAKLDEATIKGANFAKIIGNSGGTFSVTHDMIKSTKSYSTDKDLSGVSFSTGDLSAFNFNNINLNSTRFFATELEGATFINADLQDADLSLALMESVDLRAANMSGVKGFSPEGHWNLIHTDGKIYDIILSDERKFLRIAGGSYIDRQTGQETLLSAAYLDGVSTSIRGGTLSLVSNGMLELRKGSGLVLTSTGNLHIEFDQLTLPNGGANIMIEDGSSLIIETDVFMEIMIADLSELTHFEATLLSWENDASIDVLLPRLENDTAFRINGKSLADLGFTATFDRVNKTYSISYFIPEPSTVTLSLLALTVLLSRRRRGVQC